jgi:hypothetical protein
MLVVNQKHSVIEGVLKKDLTSFGIPTVIKQTFGGPDEC